MPRLVAVVLQNEDIGWVVRASAAAGQYVVASEKAVASLAVFAFPVGMP